MKFAFLACGSGESWLTMQGIITWNVVMKFAFLA